MFSSSPAASPSVVASGSSSLPVQVSITLHRYLCWLVQLQASADAICDDAYTLDRLTLQSVVPLRQRSSPPTAAQVGLKAAVYELLVGAAERQNLELLIARQQHRAWKLTGAGRRRSQDGKASTFSHFPPSSLPVSHTSTSDASTAGGPAIVHGSNPPCACRVLLAQQRAPSAGPRSRSSSSSSSIGDEGKDSTPRLFFNTVNGRRSSDRKQKHNAADGEKGKRSEAAFVTSSAANSIPGTPSNGAPLLPLLSPLTSALGTTVITTFPARLKDAVRHGSDAAVMQPTSAADASRGARTPPSFSHNSSLLDPAHSDTPRDGPSTGTHNSQKVAVQLLLPITAAEPLRPVSAMTGTEEDEDDRGNSSRGSNRSRNGSGKAKQPPATTAPLSASSSPPFVTVSPGTLSSRTLHAFWSHVAAEELRRCSLCGGQVLLQSTWHGLYLLQLLTLLSAAPAMAAPLPLPPPSVLKLQPAEALLLLLQTAQRCFVAGVALSSAVCVQLAPAATVESASRLFGSESGEAASSSFSTNAALLVGVARHNSMPATSAATATAAPSALDVLRGGHGGGPSPTVLQQRQQQQQNQEQRLLSVLTLGIFRLVNAVGGVAAPTLWPVELGSGTDVLLATARRSLVSRGAVLMRLRGDALALRFRVFHAAFLILITRDGADKGITVLHDASLKLMHVVATLRGAQQLTSQDVTNHDEKSSSSVLYATAAHALKLLTRSHPISTTTETADGDVAPDNSNSNDDSTVLDDDLRALCCVTVLLTVFANLVRAQETTPHGPVEATSAAAWLTDAATHAMDALVFPTLTELQNSSRGNCSAQARPLLALWWLIRAETVRQCAYHYRQQEQQLNTAAAAGAPTTATTPLTNTAVAATPGSVIRVLEQCVSLLGDEGEFSSSSAAAAAPAEGVTGGVQHWSAWLKDASRAAGRTSNAANEFLGLTFRPSSLFGASSPLLSTSARTTALRWRLPLDVSLEENNSTTPTASPAGPSPSTPFEHLEVAPLPLAWLRMWLLLCPPLFHISPTDVLALRHSLQEQQEKEKMEKAETARAEAVAAAAAAKAAAAAAKAAASELKNTVTSPSGARKPPAKAGAHGRKGIQKSNGKASDNTRGTVRVSLDRTGSVNPGGSPRRAENASPGKSAKAPAPPLQTINEAPCPLSSMDTMQQLYQFSVEPVYFWIRWCQLFLPNPPPTPQSTRKWETPRQSRATLPASSVSAACVSAAVSDVVALLRTPSRAWTASALHGLVLSAQASASPTMDSMVAPPVSGTQFVDTMHHAFPLFAEADLVAALKAQGQQFVQAEGQTGLTFSREERVDHLFASYSFAAALPPLREEVSAVHEDMLDTAASQLAANASTTPCESKEEGRGEEEEEISGAEIVSKGGSLPASLQTRTAATATASPLPSPLQHSLPSPPRAPSLPRPDGAAATGATELSTHASRFSEKTDRSSSNNDARTQLKQPARITARRPPLMAARTLPRRAAEGKAKSVPPPPPPPSLLSCDVSSAAAAAAPADFTVAASASVESSLPDGSVAAQPPLPPA